MKIKTKNHYRGRTAQYLSLGLFLSFLFPQITRAASPFDYHLLESFPGFYTSGSIVNDLPSFILAIYKFGIWTIAIAGLFMLVIGGFMYMSSAGNNSLATNAKGIIADAVVGIIAAMCAYLILYVINPDLTKIDIKFSVADVSSFGGEKGTGNPNPQSINCKSDEMLGKIKSASRGKLDPCLTFAMLNTESGCTASAQSGAGACGIAQIMPSTAGVSCDKLKSDVDFSIAKGVSLLSGAKNSSKIRGNINGTGSAFDQAARDLYASYNGGMGCLDASRDCDSSMKNAYGFNYVKWDCPNNPGGYTETVTATARFLTSYKACKADAAVQGKLN